jgi:hypothetical protein
MDFSGTRWAGLSIGRRAQKSAETASSVERTTSAVCFDWACTHGRRVWMQVLFLQNKTGAVNQGSECTSIARGL